MMMKRPSNHPHAQQSGIVLVVALVMLVVISLASVAIMRSTLSADNVSENNRRQAQALQAAQTALRFCESKVVDSTLVPAAAASSPQEENWKAFSKWSSASDRKVVDAEFLKGADSNTPNVANPPQCMAQYRALAGSDQIVVITARGFSDNYVEKNGRTQSGAVIWLQSILQLAASDV